MPIVSVKIHPAIGIARVGNSPADFFIGPECPGEQPNPPGGFKDAQCRVKRQAARFRIFATDDSDIVNELTAAEADITWTVHLANKKAVRRNAGLPAADMTIDPGPRTLTGPNQQKLFDAGQIKFSGVPPTTVPLGEVRTDGDGRLLVLGGFGSSASPIGEDIDGFLDSDGWFDDISDGPITATVKLQATGDTFDADGAWVLVTPPKFAPQIDNVITLYDAVFQVGATQGWHAGPVVPSYTQHIQPILQRARDQHWVINIGGVHSWTDPVYEETLRQAIFSRLANPAGGGGNMPSLAGGATLTPTQYAIMENWKNDNFTRDWAGSPPLPAITPAGLDQAALMAGVGAAFFPGIEAGGIDANPIIDSGNYVGAADPMRLKHAVLGPGSMSEYMALPWQADFYACGTSWWPVPRPNSVIPEGTSSRKEWARDVGSYEEMVAEWHTLGFVVKHGSQYVEVDRCDTTFITLLTPHLNFQDVPQGPSGMSRKTALGVVFEVKSTGAAVTLDLQAGSKPSHARLTVPDLSVSVGPTIGNTVATARLWVIYETGAVNESIDDQLTITHAASGRTWNVTISASTAARKTTAVAMVLDRSGSMSESRGDSQSKYQSLKEAASVFVDVMVQNDGIALVRYNEDAQPLAPVAPLGAAGDPFDTTRVNTKNIINGPDLAPSGATSIGDGIFEGRQLLDAASAVYDQKALVIMTDGKENRTRFISEVSAQINERTYAVGLGTPENTSAAALQTLSGNNGGYLLVTGAITTDNRFILQKYFLQILAGISNAEVALDPDAGLVSGRQQRIPFQLTEADAGIDVILLTPYPKAVDFQLQTPNGYLLPPWRAIAEADMEFTLSEGVAFYRIALPVDLLGDRPEQAGTWHALLTIGSPQLSRPDAPSVVRGRSPFQRLTPRELTSRPTLPRGMESKQAAQAFLREQAVRGEHGARTLPLSLLVHTYSNLCLRASLDQSGYEPGAQVSLRASLSESGIPVLTEAAVWAEITRPDGSIGNFAFSVEGDGQFAGTFATSASGVYRCRVRATGRSRAGHPFHREQTLTAPVWRGGDRAPDPNRDGLAPLVRWLEERDEKLCQLLKCLLAEHGTLSEELEKRLREAGLDLDRVRKCVAVACAQRPDGGSGRDPERDE